MADNEAFTQIFYYDRPALRPTARTWAKHILLLLLTIATATVAGSIYPFGPNFVLPSEDPANWTELFWFIFTLPSAYGGLVVSSVGSLFTNWEYLRHGLSFSLSLLFILTCHEMGHYIACRIYRVDATLPYFIPTPPMIGPAGTFGAFIKILSPMPSRKAVFDIGVAGPIAGFAALIPIAIIGLLTSTQAESSQLADYSGIIFVDPLFMQMLAYFGGIDLGVTYGNAFYYAAWVGLLVTALNLIPSGQLDGGHAIYAVFGEKAHLWTGRVSFVLMAVFSILGLLYFNSPSGFLIAILLGVMMRVPHPQPWDTTPLDAKRKLIAVGVLIMFALCFVPFPIKIA